MTCTDESTISVTLEDGSVVHYCMRGLADDEIEPWAQFCSSVFSYKANPPPSSYFERHFYNDPDRNASFVRVMMHNGQIVSSCRIFHRQISLNGHVLAGGIGEVCTVAQHRKRGLSKILLHNSIQIMMDRGMKLSLLHAAPAFFPVYEKSGGYECVTSRWSLVTVVRSNLNGIADPFTVRLAQFPKDTAQLQKIHQQYSERRFHGCILRSEAYWNSYISKELEGTMWTLARPENDEVVAWLSVRPRGDCYQTRDFGCDTDSIAVSKALSLLLKVALGDIDDEEVGLHLPTALVTDVEPNQPTFLDMNTIKAQDDDGWMYKALQSDQKPMGDATKMHDHLIWPADSF